MKTVLKKEDAFQCVVAMSVAKGHLSADPEKDCVLYELDDAIEMIIDRFGNYDNGLTE